VVSLEQLKLLETKVIKAIEFIEKVTGENAFLKGKLNSCQQRIDELEVVVTQFREEEKQIDNKFHSIFDRLNQIEDAWERKSTGDSNKALETKESESPINYPMIHKTDETPGGPDSWNPVNPQNPEGNLHPSNSAEVPGKELDIF
jgi:chromosome segregation ATPase